MDGIFNHRLVYSEVVQAGSDYKKSYLYWFGNIVCGDLTWSNWSEKDLVCVPPGLVWEKGENQFL